jgi:hypothetical protein
MITFEKFIISDKSLLLKAIKSISDEVDAQDKSIADQKKWDWQYEDLPTKQSYIYLAKENNSVIGYYHIPTYDILIKNKKMIIGNIQSVAIAKSHRGNDLFQKLAKFANRDINKHVDLIYTFPNHRSIHTFIKYNDFSKVAMLPLQLRPISVKTFFAKKLNSKFLGSILGSLIQMYSYLKRKDLNQFDQIKEVNEFNKEMETLFLKFGSRHDIGLKRDASFLKWRFKNSVEEKYKIVVLLSDSELVAVAVVKFEYILSERCLLIMDLAYNHRINAKKILSNIDTLYGDEDISFVVKLGSSIDKNIEKQVGFMKVPSKINPRKLYLLARWSDKKNSNNFFKSAKWNVTFSDWDVF